MKGNCPGCGTVLDFVPSANCIGVACSCGAFVPLPLRSHPGGSLAEMLAKLENEDRERLHRRLVADIWLAVGKKEVSGEAGSEEGRAGQVGPLHPDVDGGPL